MAQVKVYGADWCGMTTRVLTHLQKLGVQYEYINVEENDEASSWVRQQNEGKEKKPTIDISGEIVVEPSNSRLEQVLRAHSLVQ